MILDKVGLIYKDAFMYHLPPFKHPENPDRLEAILDKLKENKLWNPDFLIAIRQASLEELSLVHSKEHIATVKAACQANISLDSDTYTSSGSWEAAVLSAGGLMVAVEEILKGNFKYIFSLNRPPGHHATSNRSMGFCLFNNIALAAAYALEKKLSRIAIIDWDAHHGNGTQQIFYNNNQVLYISFHQYPHYPGTGDFDEIGQGQGEGFNINFPYPEMTGGSAYYQAFSEIIEPILTDYQPQLMLISAGFDGHYLDPLSSLKLTEDDFAWFGKWLKYFEKNIDCRGIIMTLEGGYNLIGLAESVTQLLLSISGKNNEDDLNIQDKNDDSGKDINIKVKSRFCRYWKL